MAKTAVLVFEVVGHECYALLDRSTSHSFIRPIKCELLGLQVRRLHETCRFTVANGQLLHTGREVTVLCMRCGSGEFPRGPAACDIFLGLGWLLDHRMPRYSQPDELGTCIAIY